MDFVDFIIILSFSLIADAIEFVGYLIALAGIETVVITITIGSLAWLVGTTVDAGIALYFYLKGTGEVKYLIGAILEKLPIDAWLPIRTVTVIIIYFTQKAEEEIGKVAEVGGLAAEGEAAKEAGSLAKKPSALGKALKYIK